MDFFSLCYTSVFWTSSQRNELLSPLTDESISWNPLPVRLRIFLSTWTTNVFSHNVKCNVRVWRNNVSARSKTMNWVMSILCSCRMACTILSRVASTNFPRSCALLVSCTHHQWIDRWARQKSAINSDCFLSHDCACRNSWIWNNLVCPGDNKRGGSRLDFRQLDFCLDHSQSIADAGCWLS